MHTQSVLVGLDLNGVNAPAILARACQIYDPDDIEVVHVWRQLLLQHVEYTAGTFADARAVDASVREEADQKLAEVCSRFGITRHKVLDGERASALHEYAREHADLLIVGSHGRPALQTMLGSSSNAIVHGTPCDVLAVHVSDDEDHIPDQYERILVAVDLSDESLQVMDHAVGIADATTADVALCHVYSSRKEHERRRERQQLAQLGSLYDVDECLVYSKVGRVAHEIHALAKELYADLIVVGTHGKHGMELAKGSMANAVMHGAKCDALSVRLAA